MISGQQPTVAATGGCGGNSCGNNLLFLLLILCACGGSEPTMAADAAAADCSASMASVTAEAVTACSGSCCSPAYAAAANQTEMCSGTFLPVDRPCGRHLFAAGQVPPKTILKSIHRKRVPTASKLAIGTLFYMRRACAKRLHSFQDCYNDSLY